MDLKQIKDSGQTREFSTGSHRDMALGKGRCDLLPAYAVLKVLELDSQSTGDINNHLNTSYQYALKYLNGEDISNIYLAARNAIIAVGIDEGKDVIDIKDTKACLSYGLMKVSIHYEEGANKYGERNWEKGQPCHVLLDSGMRHTLKAISNIVDEPHIRAAAWNYLCLIWTEKYLPDLQDIPTRM